jgi:hypothetical protein
MIEFVHVSIERLGTNQSKVSYETKLKILFAHSLFMSATLVKPKV